jgi:signal transduction histidine kinase
VLKYFDRKSGLLIISAVLLIVWYTAVQLISSYITDNTDKNWNEILEKNIETSSKTVKELFGEHQKHLLGVSDLITLNTKVRKYTADNNGTALYETIRRMNLDKKIAYEIYNTRMNLISFSGKQLFPDTIRLQKALSGNKFSVIKDIGFHTYLIIYSPVHNEEDNNTAEGVSVTASLIDVKPGIRNKFFSGFGLSEEIKKRIDANIDLIPTDLYYTSVAGQNNILQYSYSLELKGIDNSVIGRIDVKGFDRESYKFKLKEFTSKINASISFLFSLCLLGLFFIQSIRFHKRFLFIRIIVFSVLILLIRILWLQFDFPEKLIKTTLFSPQYFATSTFLGFGKSMGDLLVSLILLLVIILYTANVYSAKEFIFGVRRQYKSVYNNFYITVLSLILISLFFASFFIIGLINEGIIADSNINFLDKTNLFPSIDLLSVFTILLIITFAFLFFNSSVLIILIAKIKNSLTGYKLKKFLIPLLFLVFTAINFASRYLIDYKVSFLAAEISIILVFLFAYYIHRFSFLKRNFRIFTFRNFMAIVLMSVLLSPLLILEKLDDKEPEFIELLGKTLTNQEEERAVFLISNGLLNINQNENLEVLIKDANSIPKLAYHIWSGSRISSENFNSLIIITDSNKKLLSDFNINPAALDADSVLKFVAGKILNKPYSFDIPNDSADAYYEEEVPGEEVEYYPIAFENVKIFKNVKEKYYIGITAIETSRMKGTISHTPLGFVMIVLQTDIKNTVLKSTQQFFRPYSQDNLLTKIISTPKITEFINNKIETASDEEISREVESSLNEFLQYAAETGNRRMWKNMIYEGRDYETFYILSEPKDTDDPALRQGINRVFAISVKKFDFYVLSFYYLKYIILGILILFLLYLIYGIIFIHKIRNIRFNFRSKLLMTFLVISVIPITILGIYSRTFLINKNDQNTRDIIRSDLDIVSEVIKNADARGKNSDTTGLNYKNILGRYFLKTDKNFNIFINSKLVTTTNDELYTSDLLDTRLDADAHYNIVKLRKEYFLKNQSSGDLSYLEGYKPITGRNDSVEGVISSLSVYREQEISEELTETLTYIFSSYFLLIFLILILVTVFSGRLSKPILELKEAADRVSRGDTDVEIYLVKRKDEIGSLVESFNDMTKKLEKSKEELKRAEREAAWRDIARRVAHEIKNPLTPMKLSIQHLKSVFKIKSDEEFGSILDKTERLITGEIDKLNRIATEFSNFAKLPSRNYEPININEIIEEVILLYSTHKDIEFKKELYSRELPVLADRQEINRVFHNLLKNSVQAIDDKGIITVRSYGLKEFAIVEIVDNGEGIEPEILKKLFEPNFSIKSRGMGLGLAITKKSLDDMNAKIKIQSKPGHGTKVTIRFNLHTEENENQI